MQYGFLARIRVRVGLGLGLGLGLVRLGVRLGVRVRVRVGLGLLGPSLLVCALTAICSVLKYIGRLLRHHFGVLTTTQVT